MPFDSAPQIGSIGRAIDLAAEAIPAAFVPLVVGAPAIGRYQAFGHLEWQPGPHWTLNAGGLFARDQLSGSQFAPRLFANWKPVPGQTLKAGVSEAFRTPSLFEQRADWQLSYQGQVLDEKRQQQLISLFKLRFDDPQDMRADVQGKPVYLGLAMNDQGLLKLKPQNLLLNLPLAREV